MPIELIHRDDHVVVVNKPSGIAVHRGWASDRVTLLDLVRDAVGQYVYPAHRLDRATSGLIVFTLSTELVTHMQAAFASGSVVKNYLALTRGVVPELGLVVHGLRKSKQHERRPAQTAVRRLGTFERYSLVEARPFTGRLHQIRRHLKHIAHPLLGDTRYGKGEHNRRFRAEFDLHRLALHASKLQFPHPVTQEVLELRARVPTDLSETLQRIGLYERAEQAVLGPIWQPDAAALPSLGEVDV